MHNNVVSRSRTPARWTRPLACALLIMLLVGAPAQGMATSTTVPPTGGPFGVVAGQSASTGGDLALAALRLTAARPATAVRSDAPLSLADIEALHVPFYSQRDPRWACEQIGNCTCDLRTCRTERYTTLGDAGCYPTCQAMLFAYYAGGGFLDPSAYNACLVQHSGYEPFPGACAAGLCGALDDPPAACRPEGLVYVGPSLDKELLDQDLRGGHPAIGVVDVGVPGRSPHAVIVVGRRDGRYLVNDPYYGTSPYRRTTVAPAEIYGFHRWRGPVPAGVEPARAAGHAPAVAAGMVPAGPLAPSYRAAFVSDVTVPDGTLMAPGATYVKTWELRNVGTADWNEEVRLVHVGGANPAPVSSVSAEVVPVGDSGQVSVQMTAPRRRGPYVSRWQLVSPEEQRFGPVIWVEIRVVGARMGRWSP